MKEQIVYLFSKPPASFQWSSSADGRRTMGSSEGFVLDIWPDRVEAAAIFPPDRLDLVERNNMLMHLLLGLMRPDWASASNWLAVQMRTAARHAGLFEEVNITRRVRFVWDRTQSRATLKVSM